MELLVDLVVVDKDSHPQEVVLQERNQDNLIHQIPQIMEVLVLMGSKLDLDMEVLAAELVEQLHQDKMLVVLVNNFLDSYNPLHLIPLIHILHNQDGKQQDIMEVVGALNLEQLMLLVEVEILEIQTHLIVVNQVLMD
jgi:hypothetical protein